METLESLLNKPSKEKSEAWLTDITPLIYEASFELLNEQTQNGPDGFPYLLAEKSEQGETFPDLLRWIKTRGIGLAINPNQTEGPDLILTYGMLWNFIERGRFVNPLNQPGKELEKARYVQGGPPEDYLPLYVRKILRQFCMDQGFLRVQIALYSWQENQLELSFLASSLDNLEKNEEQRFLEAIGWFLPLDTRLSIVKEDKLPGFVDL